MNCEVEQPQSLELAGGELLDGTVFAGVRPPDTRPPITLRLSQLERVLGIPIDREIVDLENRLVAHRVSRHSNACPIASATRLTPITNEAIAASASGRIRSTVLPLVEFSLTWLWQLQDDGVLRADTFRRIGGIAGGVSRWAEQTYQSLSDPQQATARRIITRLTRLGDESRGLPDRRHRRTLDELAIAGSPPEVQAVVDVSGKGEQAVLTRLLGVLPVGQEPGADPQHVRADGLVRRVVVDERVGILTTHHVQHGQPCLYDVRLDEVHLGDTTLTLSVMNKAKMSSGNHTPTFICSRMVAQRVWKWMAFLSVK